MKNVFKMSVLAVVVAASGVACSNGGGKDKWQVLIDDPATDRNALYDKNAKVCASSTEGARPGCTYHYDGTKMHITEDPQRDAPAYLWVTVTETQYTTECSYEWDWYYEDYVYVCYDVPYYVTYQISPSGVKYATSNGRAVNSGKSSSANGFIASNKNAKEMINKTAAKYVAVYGMSRAAAGQVAAQVLTAKSNKGILEEQDTLAATIAAAFPKTLSSKEVSSALADAKEKKDLTSAKALLDRVAARDLSGMTPEQRDAFLRNEIGLGL